MTITYANFTSVIDRANFQDREILVRARKMLFPVHGRIAEILGSQEVVFTHMLVHPEISEFAIGRAMPDMGFETQRLLLDGVRHRVWVKVGCLSPKLHLQRLLQGEAS